MQASIIQQPARAEHAAAAAGNSSLTDREIQVWTWRCPGETMPAAFGNLLSGPELARADNFVTERERARFIAAHAGLRLLLGALLDADPACVAFSKDDRGKPRLCGDAAPPLFFSLSCSHDLAAVAISDQFEVGLDIEMLRAVDLSGIVCLFSKAEQAALAELPAEARTTAIYCALTRKEAFAKAIGLGLTIPFDSFEVSLAPDEPARLLRIAETPDEAASWSLAHLTPARDYVGAVAAQAIGWRPVLNETDLDRLA